jgi:type VI secretion system secreted protein Hcp
VRIDFGECAAAPRRGEETTMSVFHRSTDGFEQSEPNRREVLLAAGGLAAATAIAGHSSGSHAADKKRPIPATSSAVIDDPDFTAFDVVAWSWGASNSGTTHTGGGGGVGKANVQDLSLTKRLDTNSPKLFRAVVTGEHFEKVTLTWVGPKGTPTVKIVMEEVLVTSVSTGGTTSETALTENVTFNFAKVAYSFDAVTTSYDIAANEV